MDDSTRPESFLRRLLWKNSGILCVATLLTLPIILGVAVGYIIVLAIVTSYKKITGQKSREEKESEAAKKIRIVMGHELLDSVFTKPVNLPAQQKKRVIQRPCYGSMTNNSNVTLSSDESETQDDVDTDEEETRRTEVGVKENEEVEKVNNCADNNSENANMVTNDSHADRSRATSASSEYYSTVTEMEEPTGDKTAHKPQESPVNQGKAMSEIHSRSPVNALLQNSENRREEVAPVIPGNEMKISSHVRANQSPALGKLKYSIQYMKDRNQLQVTILKAVNLLDLTSNTPPSSYVKVCLLPQRFCWQRTKVIVETRDPVYNETFVISGFSNERFGAYTLLISVINAVSQWQGHYGDLVIGEIYVPLIHLTKTTNDHEKGMCEWAELKPKMAEIPGSSTSGKINIALCYRPISGRLIVTIKGVKELKCENKEKFDPYVKLALYCDGTRVGRGATRVKRRVTNPVFNEKFNFDLTADQIAYTTIVLKAINNIDNTHSCLGTTVIGYDSSGNGQEHWLCMMECLSKHVEAWHMLYD